MRVRCARKVGLMVMVAAIECGGRGQEVRDVP